MVCSYRRQASTAQAPEKQADSHNSDVFYTKRMDSKLKRLKKRLETFILLFWFVLLSHNLQRVDFGYTVIFYIELGQNLH